MAKIGKLKDIEDLAGQIQQMLVGRAVTGVIADSDFMTAKILKAAMESKGMGKIVTEWGPKQILEEIGKNKMRFLIFYAVNHKDMNGVNFLQELKKSPARDCCRVVLLTDMDVAAVEPKLKELGVYCTAHKPLDPKMVSVSLDKALQFSPAAQSCAIA
jgi:DNA-binding response OmpR family regulator